MSYTHKQISEIHERTNDHHVRQIRGDPNGNLICPKTTKRWNAGNQWISRSYNCKIDSTSSLRGSSSSLLINRNSCIRKIVLAKNKEKNIETKQFFLFLYELQLIP
ncbi:hypothetical protein SAY86_002321 [Trapa natans]|uniref:Uncharacterized protein n=1 Tax=Trapa natans TaxID=22666 RepID=A0AAN7LTM1_TRANT|nr:hypothetical protein SAY86_002321 [Trapa natans]